MVLLVLIHTTHPFCSSSDIAHSSMHFICHIVGVLVASYFFLLYHFYLCEMTTWQKQVFNGYLLQIEIWCEQCSLCCTAQCTLTHITKQSENFGLIHCWKIIFCHVNYMFMWGNGGTPTQTKPYLRWKKNWNMTYIHRFPFHNFVSFVCCAITRYLLPWASRGSEESVAESVLVTTTNTFLANYRANFRLFMMLGITKCIHGWNKRI